jgi:hypothetical protein
VTILSPSEVGVRPSKARFALGLVLLAFALAIFANLDPLLAWKDEIPELGQGRLFAYYTTQSNFLAAAALAVHGVQFVRGRRPGVAAEYLRGLATVDMAITGIVAGLLLAEPDAPFTYSDFVLHQGGPLLMVLWFVVLPPLRALPWTAALVWLAHPFVWTVTTLTYAAESPDHWVPYFFLDSAEMDGWGGVILVVAIIHFVVLGLGLLAVLASRARWRAGMWRRLGLDA